MDSCNKHPHEKGVALCRRCGGAWCSNCLVYSFGPKKPPFCMSCAMVAGGVRTGAAPAPMPRRMLKAQMKAMKAEAKAAAKAAAAPPASGTAAEPEAELAEASGTTDWDTPWWEDREPATVD